MTDKVLGIIKRKDSHKTNTFLKASLKKTFLINNFSVNLIQISNYSQKQRTRSKKNKKNMRTLLIIIYCPDRKLEVNERYIFTYIYKMCRYLYVHCAMCTVQYIVLFDQFKINNKLWLRVLCQRLLKIIIWYNQSNGGPFKTI